MLGASQASCTFMPNSTTLRKNCNRFWSCESPPWTANARYGLPSLVASVGVSVARGRWPGGAQVKGFSGRAGADDVERILGGVEHEALHALRQADAGLAGDHGGHPAAARRHRDHPALVVGGPP